MNSDNKISYEFMKNIQFNKIFHFQTMRILINKKNREAKYFDKDKIPQFNEKITQKLAEIKEIISVCEKKLENEKFDLNIPKPSIIKQNSQSKASEIKLFKNENQYEETKNSHIKLNKSNF